MHLGDKNVGDIVKIAENGTPVEYIIVHKGKPSTMYDNSCIGVWVLRKDIHSYRVWDGTKDNYENSYDGATIRTWLGNTFLNTIDEIVRESIKTVKIPYHIAHGTSGMGEGTGSKGLSCKVFLLSAYEVGVGISTMCEDGAILDYFLDADDDLRKAVDINGADATWWLRTPYATNGKSVVYINDTGKAGSSYAYNNIAAVRPAFVLPEDLAVGPNGDVSINALPTITSDKTGDLGTLAEGFTCTYSVTDDDEADTLHITLSMDGATIKTFRATKGTEYTHPLTGTDWLKVTNGEHTFGIAVTDDTDTVTSTATFTRDCNKLSTSLTNPFAADDVITACTLSIEGYIPEDAICKYEVTNNALDDEPVWEDCTATVKSGFSYLFQNDEAENGFAFNYRISIQRGESNEGGYITSISGGFE